MPAANSAAASRATWMFTVAGVWVGGVVVVAGWMVSIPARALNLQTLTLAHQDHLVLWLVDLAPVLFGWGGYLLGLNQALSGALTSVHRRLEELPTMDEPPEVPPEDPTVDFNPPEDDTEATAERQPLHTIAVARFAHELRTPLNAILGYTDLVREELAGEGRTDLVTDLERVARAGEHLAQLMESALDLSLIQAHRLPIALQDVPLDDVVGMAVAAVRPAADANRNRLEVEVDPGLSLVRADPLRLRQILLNLLGNACKFTADGTVRLVVTAREGQVFLRVIDTGIGMSEKQQSRLFREFAQADPSIQGRFGGTGLGLVISRRLAEMMAGRLEVESQEGVGSTFTLTLPAAEGVRTAEELTQGVPRGATVLFVTGDTVLLDLLRRVLPDGMKALVAVTAAQGIERAHELRPAAVVVAEPLPDGSSLDVLRALKERRGGTQLPVLVVTRREDAEQALKLGAAEAMWPPLDLRNLGRKLGRYRVSDAAILLVQRAGTMRRLLREAFYRDGWTTDAVDDGVAAITSWRGDLPNLVVVELGAEGEGQRLLEILAETPGWSSVPLLAYSQRTLVGWRLPELVARADRVVVCGSDLPEDILEAVRDAVGELVAG